MRQVEISHRDIADCAARMSLMRFKVEELAPRENFNHISASPGDILNSNILVGLISVGAHFQTQQSTVVVETAWYALTRAA